MASPSLFRVVLPVDDLPRADAFYARLLGLEIDAAIPSRHYVPTGGAVLVLVDTAEHARGHGHEPAPFRANPDWIYIRVPDLDAVWERAVRLECPTSKDGEGSGISVRDWGDRSFYTYDPSGNPICLIDDVNSDTPPSRTKYMGADVPSVRAVVLPTRSLGRAEAFFEELLGVDADPSVPNRHFFLLDRCQLSLVDPIEHTRSHGLEPRPFRANPDLVYFAVPDLDATFERAQKLRMEPLREDHDVVPGIHNYPWGERSFYGQDPSGNPICFVDDANLYLGSGR
jgi:catechol 2,3-dioxygenase-like lactoylglutathione lyase family enzyme